MLRYFQSIVTGRPLNVGGRSFIFEPVMPLGGGWLGVLAVDDESAASILAAATDEADEITEEAYNTFKKKRSGRVTQTGFVPSQTPQIKPQPLLPSAVPAVSPTASTGTEAPPASPEPAGPNVSLGVTDAEPPHEPLLEPAIKAKKGGKKK